MLPRRPTVAGVSRPVALALLAHLALTALACDGAVHDGGSAPRPTITASPAVPRFLKGQLHAHTDRSGDSDTPAGEVAAWYAAHGYDFVVLTDHDHVTRVASPDGTLVLRGVEITQNLRTCDPPAERGDACLLHVNALFVAPGQESGRLGPPASLRRADVYGRAVDRALALGGLAQLNHPNFQHGADLEVLLALHRRGLSLVEIANEAADSDNEGDARHPSTEALWDAALGRGARVLGTATDDAHHYADAARVRARGETAYTGDRGFVMVRAAKTEDAIRAAIVAGDFYASTGVVLDRVEIGPGGVEIEVRGSDSPCTFEVIANGRVAQRTEGVALSFDPRPAAPGYVRVRVTDARGRRAWTQPLML